VLPFFLNITARPALSFPAPLSPFLATLPKIPPGVAPFLAHHQPQISGRQSFPANSFPLIPLPTLSPEAENRSPLFSYSYTLFVLEGFPHPPRFQSLPHSLHKTGWAHFLGGSSALATSRCAGKTPGRVSPCGGGLPAFPAHLAENFASHANSGAAFVNFSSAVSPARNLPTSPLILLLRDSVPLRTMGVYSGSREANLCNNSPHRGC